VIHRVLIVEDHEPFRRTIRQSLQQRPDVLIVGEAADGLDGIRQAEAQRPDVIVLDIGLPSLNGIEVADRIRASVPDARVMFVTNESSLEVVELVLRRGGHGYVYKPRTQRDLLPAFEAIVRGAQFVGGGIERIARGDGFASHRHSVLFYSSDSVLLESFTRFIASELQDGNAVGAMMTEAHHLSLRQRLQAAHVDLARAIRQQRYFSVNVSEMFARVMIDGRPSRARLQDAVEEMVCEATRGANGRDAKVAVCGEASAVLWAQGRVEAAIELENLWDEIVTSRRIDTLCAFPVNVREQNVQAVRSLCAEHTAVEIA
jgi:DNA-binding NarL/FixJ family response regulator